MIDNHSFENWSATGDWIGAIDLDDWYGVDTSEQQGAQYDNTNFTIGTDGVKHAFVNTQSGADYRLMHDTGEMFIHGALYSLTVAFNRTWKRF